MSFCIVFQVASSYHCWSPYQNLAVVGNPKSRRPLGLSQQIEECPLLPRCRTPPLSSLRRHQLSRQLTKLRWITGSFLDALQQHLQTRRHFKRQTRLQQLSRKRPRRKSPRPQRPPVLELKQRKRYTIKMKFQRSSLAVLYCYYVLKYSCIQRKSEFLFIKRSRSKGMREGRDEDVFRVKMLVFYLEVYWQLRNVFTLDQNDFKKACLMYLLGFSSFEKF